VTQRRLAEADLSVAVPVAGRLLRGQAVPVPARWPGRPVPERRLDEAGLDAELARGWTLLRAVDYQLWGLNLGLTEDPALCATVLGWLSLTGRP
jgi:hypothetical protein